MTFKRAFIRYITQILVEYGTKIEMDGRTWHN
jgi:hypothetical protein